MYMEIHHDVPWRHLAFRADHSFQSDGVTESTEPERALSHTPTVNEFTPRKGAQTFRMGHPAEPGQTGYCEPVPRSNLRVGETLILIRYRQYCRKLVTHGYVVKGCGKCRFEL